MPTRAVRPALLATLILAGTWCQAFAVTNGSGTQDLQNLPDAMIGTWGWSIGACAKANDDGRVAIGARSVDFYASSYALRTIVLQVDRTINATAIVHDEGEEGTTQGSIELKLVADGRLRIRTDSGLDNVYTRCAQPY